MKAMGKERKVTYRSKEGGNGLFYGYFTWISFFNIHFLKKIFIYVWLCWVFIAVCRLSLAAVHGFHIVVASLRRAQPLGRAAFSRYSR